MNSRPPTTPAPALTPAVGALERRMLAVGASVLLHIILLAIGSVAAAMVAASRARQGLPAAPLLVVAAVALVMAHTSLGGIWWARSTSSMHLRTVLATVTVAGMWMLLVLILDETRHSGIRAGAWAACLVTQMLVTAALATAIEFVVDRPAAAARSRFSIGFILFWTTAIAVALAGAGAWGANNGWKVADIAGWTYFAQLQAVGITGGLLATVVYASVRSPRRWMIRTLSCLAAVVVFGAASPAVVALIFGVHVGASQSDLVWLFAGQGLFLVVSLVPIEIARSGSLAGPA